MALTKKELRAADWADGHFDEVLAAAQQSMFGTEKIGFCIDCDAEVQVYEGDARENRCECCGGRGVYAAEELMLYVAI
jgi:hypothetical protein